MFQKMDVLTLAQATAALDDIESRRAQFIAAAAKGMTDLAAAEANLGERVLAGDDDACAGVATLRLKIDGLNAAGAVLEKRREVAQLDYRRAQAADFRRQAAAKQADLAALESKTSKVLVELSRLESVEYDGCILGAQRIGAWISRTTLAAQPWQSTLEVGSDPLNSTPYAIPRSRRLRDEADALERRALEIEAELLRAAEPVPTPAAPGDLTPATHTGTCFCGPCRRARQNVSPNEWAAAVEGGADA